MDLVRISDSTWLPNSHVLKDYSTLIWHERFQGVGEFEMRTTEVAYYLNILPEKALVSHLGTDVVMEVATREISKGQDGIDELVIKGYSVDDILQHRWVDSTYQKKRTMRRAYSATSAACVLLVNAVDNASGKDLTRGDTAAGTPELNDYPWTTKDALPNIMVTESVPSEGDIRNWVLEEGILYPQLLRILQADDLGLRVIRPTPNSKGTVITVASALATRGQVTRTANQDINGLRFDIYRGIDNSGFVQFKVKEGHLESVNYLLSNRDYKTAIQVTSSVGISEVYRNTAEAALTGRNRRVMGFDAGSPEIPPEPTPPAPLRKNATKPEREARATAMDKYIDQMAAWRNKRENIIEAFKTEARARALDELKKARKVSLATADISPDVPRKYRTHYNLGDLVTLVGDYGFTQKMVVGEYVRTEDSTGDRGFPGLVTP